MRVAIDVRPLRRASSGGLVQLTEGLCRALFRLSPEDSIVLYQSSDGYRLPGPLPGNVSQVEMPEDSDSALLDASLARQRADVLFRPFPVDDSLAFPSRRQCVLVPDLQHEDHPEHFADEELSRRRRAFGRAINCGGAIGLLSNHTHGRLRALFPNARATVVLVPPGLPALTQSLTTPLSESDSRLVPDGPFFLYPANLWPHKNHRRLFEAFGRFLARRPGAYSLVLTGDAAGGERLFAEYPSLPVRHLGFVSPRLLAELYRRCTALTYFSLYEGFGIPLLEAFQLGAPIVCSNTTSLAEIGGDAVLQCDPTDVGAIAALLERVADSTEQRPELQRLARSRLERYDWERSAGNLLHALRNLARQPVAHNDVLDAMQVLGDRLVASQSEQNEQLAVLEQRDRVIDELQNAVRDRTAWAERMVNVAEERAQVIEEQKQTLHLVEEQKQALQQKAERDSGLLVSVVLPLPDHRGQAVRSVQSWTRKQSLPRDRYEVIIISDGSEPDLEIEIKALLSPYDRVILSPPANEVYLYDLGARAARGRWLFFTEAHCVGDPRCLEEMVRYLTVHGVDGACCRSEGISESRLGRMEERQFRRVIRQGLEDMHWNKMILRGTALSREVYGAVGGFAWQYGLFAGPELAARLHAAGYALGYAPAAVVFHYNTNRVSELRASVHDYVRGECAYRVQHPGGDGDAYFGTPDWWRQRSLLDPAIQRSLWLSLGASLRSPGPEPRRRWKSLLRLLPGAVLGARARVWEADLKTWQAQARCWLWRKQEDRMFAAYRDLWDRLAEQAAMHALAGAQQSAHTEHWTPRDEYSLGEMPEEWLAGFHAVEELDGERFRWTSPLACIKLPLASSDAMLRLHTRGLRQGASLRAFLNGQPLAVRDVQATHGELHIELRREHFRPTPFQYLVLLCEPLRPWLHGVPDRRELGLPLFRVVRA